MAFLCALVQLQVFPKVMSQGTVSVLVPDDASRSKFGAMLHENAQAVQRNKCCEE